MQDYIFGRGPRDEAPRIDQPGLGCIQEKDSKKKKKEEQQRI